MRSGVVVGLMMGMVLGMATGLAASVGAQIPPGPGMPGYLQIRPGEGIGPIRLGMAISDVVATLGVPKSTHTDPSMSSTSSTLYRWYEYMQQSAGARLEENGGLEVAANALGTITEIHVYFDSRYTVDGVLYTGDRAAGSKKGVSEAQVRAALGEPERVTVRRGPNGEPDAHALVYATRGIIFWIGDSRDLRGYQWVYEIVVYAPR